MTTPSDEREPGPRKCPRCGKYIRFEQIEVSYNGQSYHFLCAERQESADLLAAKEAEIERLRFRMASVASALESRCGCNIDTTPCGAEDECLADRMLADELRAALSGQSAPSVRKAESWVLVCPVCRKGDSAHMRCHRPDCTDGRGLVRKRQTDAPSQGGR